MQGKCDAAIVVYAVYAFDEVDAVRSAIPQGFKF